MRILVYPHDLGMGGSQLNAIELAAAVRDLGHEVAVYGHRGVLNAHIEALGLPFVQSPSPRRRPTSRIVADLRRRVREEKWDIVHGYEWPPILEARLACTGTVARVVGTVMSMAVAPFIPRDLPLVVGTPQIAAYERTAGRRAVSVIEPPVDTVANAPGMEGDVAGFRAAHDIPDGLHLVIVSRLADQLKGEGLLTAIDAVAGLGPDVVLTIVGDGPARSQVERAAAAANAAAGRRAVVLTGQVADPRPAYGMADIALGMGGSALRAMAFAKPLVVQGEQGFWQRLEPETLDGFLWTGWYGVGDGAGHGASRFSAALAPLLVDAQLRRDLGRFARKTVESRFSLTRAAAAQEDAYLDATARPAVRIGLRGSDVAAASRFAGYKAQRWRQRLTGSRAADDFNAAPVAESASDGPGPLVVYLAGVAWDGIEGTDHRLASELRTHLPVLWVDPPRPVTRKIRPQPGVKEPPAGLHQLGPDLWRLHVVTVPGVTRPLLADIANAHLTRQVRRACTRLRARTPVGIVAHPSVRVDRLPLSACVYLVTDDCVAGAGLLGLERRQTEELVAANVDSADVTLAVSPVLAERLGGALKRVHVFPNGARVLTPAELASSPVLPPVRRAGLIGQLNERLDVALLLELARRSIPLLIVGPRYEQDPRVTRQLDELFALPSVTWMGRQPYERIPGFLGAIDVGLTPYCDSEFNRASFPLKTLEYLGAGCRVISTDLPASRWLGSDMVEVAGSAEEFVSLTELRLAEGRTLESEERCRAVASQHTWAHRATELADILRGLSIDGSQRFRHLSSEEPTELGKHR